MYESFKSLELLRHQISTRVDKSIKDYSDESINNSDTVSSTIFSACFSLVISYISHELSLNSLITFVIFICAYILTYFAYKTVLKKLGHLSIIQSVTVELPTEGELKRSLINLITLLVITTLLQKILFCVMRQNRIYVSALLTSMKSTIMQKSLPKPLCWF